MQGTKRIRRVIDKFAGFVKELDTGVTEIEGEIDCNNSVIAGLQTTNATLTGTKGLAINVAKNLRKILED